ncbi:MAG: response regulator [Candidatus Hydrogenedentes bacterium]|nr:response regulator [Candidatus Hydrogenedentota bacterium]
MAQEAPLTPALRRRLLTTLAVAFSLELTSRFLLGLAADPSLLAEALSITAVLMACAAIATLVAGTRGSRAVRGWMLLAGGALVASIILRIVAEIPALNTHPLLGAQGTFRDFIMSMTDLAGIAAWVFGFFWMVFELDTTRETLNLQHRQLLKEIDDRNRAEAVLRESEGRFRAVFENVPVSILVMSAQGRLIECNQALAAELGYSVRQLHDTGLESLVHDDDRTDFRIALEKLQASDAARLAFEARLLCRDESVIQFNIVATPVPTEHRHAAILVAVLENVSERRRREQQIQRRQKMESLEILAGGVAHDFNNLLVGVMANADHLSRCIGADSNHQQTCLEILESAQRAADLCHQLLAYAGKAPREEQIVNLDELVAGTQQLLRMTLAPKATLVLRGNPGIPAISADPAHLRQVLLSLVANASDALVGAPGTVTIATGTELLTETDFSRLLHQHAPEPGPHVYLEVADTGSGLHEDAITRIFDPFYTTKHHASGLGLAAVLGIVYAHQGLVSLKSTLGEGATFRLYFKPAPQPEAPVEISKAEPERPEGVAPGMRVLVVDDEELVRNAARRILEHSGYDVITAVDGQDGVELFETHHPSLCAVLLDLTMPRMNGETACIRMREINPTIPIILSSGYSESESSSPAIFKEVAAYIRKPYRLKQLLDILREVTAG